MGDTLTEAPPPGGAMAWRERSLMDVRLRFVQDVHRPGWSIAEVCRRYEVSRKTGYKWLERYEKAGPAGLTDRSHRPYSNQLITKCHLSSELFSTRITDEAAGRWLPGTTGHPAPSHSQGVLGSHGPGRRRRVAG